MVTFEIVLLVDVHLALDPFFLKVLYSLLGEGVVFGHKFKAFQKGIQVAVQALKGIQSALVNDGIDFVDENIVLRFNSLLDSPDLVAIFQRHFKLNIFYI